MKELLQSPLNYTGGKYKLLPQLLPLFPKNIHTFVDLFCGGGNVGGNVNCNHVIFNDIETHLISILQIFKNYNKETIFHSIIKIIDQYKLSWSCQNGYSYYNCNSNKGLGDYNKKGFYQLREDFNHHQPLDFDHYIMLYVLILFSFNNQIRFNNKGAFNLPIGKRDFNLKMQEKLSKFIDRLNQLNCSFKNLDFRSFDINQLHANDFVYCDPPYLITCATYNEQGLWDTNAEYDLLDYLDLLDKAHIRFALSNVLQSKGKENKILLNWLNKNPQYTCIPLNYNYANSNYQTKNKDAGSNEVLIINY